MTAPQRNSTLPWPGVYFNARLDRRNPKPQLRWSIPQILPSHCGKFQPTIAFIFQFSLIVLIKPCIRHEVLAFARESMWQSAIAGHVNPTHATINHILRRYAATGTLVPGKSTGAPQKTTPRQDSALFRIVRQDRFISVRALTARMRNFYGMRAGRKTIKNRLLSRSYHAYRPTTKPMLTGNHRCLYLECAQR